jgi:hypothetical protein
MNSTVGQAVDVAVELIAAYVVKDQQLRLPIPARRFVIANLTSYSVCRSELAQLDPKEISVLIEELRRGM